VGGTIAEKIISSHSAEDGFTEDVLRVKIDALLGHDATIGLLINRFERMGLSIWDTSRVIFTNDHFSPPADAERATISSTFLRFARKNAVQHLFVDRGICHQVLVEHKLCQPGSLIIGADSHTTMAGALGICATGMGSTDVLFSLATGTTWMRIPRTIKVRIFGTLGDECTGKDLVLWLLQQLGEHGAQYRAVEFHDHTPDGLEQDERFVVSNMSVEMGAKFGIFVPDRITYDFCTKRDGMPPDVGVLPDPGATYEREIELDLANLSPMVAQPWSPANVVRVDDLEPIPITTAFLGSCAGGRLSDIQAAAKILEGKAIDSQVRFIVIPASIDVFKRALDLGYVKTLTEAGAIFNQSSCGPCGGIDKGVLGRDDVCASTSNRNFQGRMGHWQSRTYLASARTVAYAALCGYIGGAR
jgi:3-isopropylmalate/(R)-2-methylmalate dehydratase large subunit